MISFCLRNKNMNITLFFIIAAINTVHSLNDYHLPHTDDDIDYSQYYDKDRTRFDQIKMNPRDYFASMFNPYYYRIPNMDFDYDDYFQNIKNKVKEYVKYAHNLYEEFEKYIPPTMIDSARNLMPSNLIYLEPSHDYFEMNLVFLETQYASKLFKLYGFKDHDYVNLIKGKHAELNINSKTSIKLQEIPDTGVVVLTEDEQEEAEEEQDSSIDDDQKYTPDFESKVKILSKTEFDAIIELMNALPHYDNEKDSYYHGKLNEISGVLSKHPFLNKDNKLFDPSNLTVENVKKMGKRTLLKNETYEFYVLRMKRLGFVPLHLKLCQTEFAAFTDKPEIPDASFFTNGEDTNQTAG